MISGSEQLCNDWSPGLPDAIRMLEPDVSIE